MAGKRLVGGAIPGTGLFVHEPKPRDRGPVPLGNNGKKPLPMVEQEEQKVNGQLVEILERKCAKQRRQADEEAQKRAAAEAKLDALTKDLADVEKRLAERERQVAELCTAQRDLAADRKTAARRETEFAEMQTQCDEAQKALKKREAENRKLHDSSGRTETEWKDQILRLVAESQSSQRRADELAQQLEGAQSEIAEITRNAQDVVLRYEEESKMRLDLESRCLTMEEKLRNKEQQVRTGLDQAHGKAKQSVQARERTEEVLKHREEKCQRAEQRAEAAEAKCQALETQIHKWQNLCSDRNRRIEELEQQLLKQCQERPLPQSTAPGVQRTVVRPPGQERQQPQTATPCTPVAQRTIVAPPSQERALPQTVVPGAPGIQRMIAPPSRIPPPAPRTSSNGSRPGTATSAVSAPSPAHGMGTATSAVSAPSPVHGAAGGTPENRGPGSARTPTAASTAARGNASMQRSNNSSGDDPAGSGRLPPGAIRRAGSVPNSSANDTPGAIRRTGSMPAKRGVGHSPEPQPARYTTRPAAGPGGNTTASAASSSPPVASGPSAGLGTVANSAVVQRAPSSRPCSSRASSDAGDCHIEDVIPSEPDSSDEEEVLSAVRTKP